MPARPHWRSQISTWPSPWAGGSTMDTAKSALCTAASGGSVADYFGFDLYEKPPLAPLVGIPTTAGTGSEVSRVAVIADATGKKAVYSSHLQPKAALVDPAFAPRPAAGINRNHRLGRPRPRPRMHGFHQEQCHRRRRSAGGPDRRLSGIRASRSPRRSRRTLSNGTLCPARRTAG